MLYHYAPSDWTYTPDGPSGGGLYEGPEGPDDAPEGSPELAMAMVTREGFRLWLNPGDVDVPEYGEPGPVEVTMAWYAIGRRVSMSSSPRGVVRGVRGRS